MGSGSNHGGYPGLCAGLVRRSGPSERDELRPFKWGRRVCRGLSSALGVARCGGSAGCVLCVLWAMSAAVLGGRYPVGVSISSFIHSY